MSFAVAFIALYVGHHVGDYWVQTHYQAMHKGAAGFVGRAACLAHVLSYLFTQAVTLFIIDIALPGTDGAEVWLALAASGVTHYTADRREHGLMFKLARRMPWKREFLDLGTPRADVRIEAWDNCDSCGGSGGSHDESTGGRCWDCKGGGKTPTWIGDNPQLATGAWALDQSWHIALGCFVPALIIAAL